jgi:hypothetical protein
MTTGCKEELGRCVLSPWWRWGARGGRGRSESMAIRRRTAARGERERLPGVDWGLLSSIGLRRKKMDSWRSFRDAQSSSGMLVSVKPKLAGVRVWWALQRRWTRGEKKRCSEFRVSRRRRYTSYRPRRAAALISTRSTTGRLTARCFPVVRLTTTLFLSKRYGPAGRAAVGPELLGRVSNSPLPYFFLLYSFLFVLFSGFNSTIWIQTYLQDFEFGAE